MTLVPIGPPCRGRASGPAGSPTSEVAFPSERWDTTSAAPQARAAGGWWRKPSLHQMLECHVPRTSGHPRLVSRREGRKAAGEEGGQLQGRKVPVPSSLAPGPQMLRQVTGSQSEGRAVRSEPRGEQSVWAGVVPAPLKRPPRPRRCPDSMWVHFCTSSLLLAQPLPVSFCDSVVLLSRVNKAHDVLPHGPVSSVRPGLSPAPASLTLPRSASAGFSVLLDTMPS